jgi:hypothetical protein
MKVVFQVIAVMSLNYFLTVPEARATTILAANAPPPMLGLRSKLIKFRFRNDLRATVDLKIGEEPVTVQPGQTINVSLPIGARITVATAIPGHPAGEVVAEVRTNLDDPTDSIKPCYRADCCRAIAFHPSEFQRILASI